MLGKLLGVFIGYGVTQDVSGAVIGFLMGFVFDLHYAEVERPLRKKDVWLTEFSYLFTILHAKFAKMDGKVTSEEVRLFQSIVTVSDEDLTTVREVYNLHRKTADGFENVALRLSEMVIFDENVKMSVLESLSYVLYGAGQEGNLYQKAFIQAVARIFSVDDAALNHLMNSVKEYVGSVEKEDSYTSSHKTHNWNVDVKYYKVLGVDEAVSEGDLKRAYKKLIMKHHPDKVKGAGGSDSDVKKAEERLAEINEAYDVLTGKSFS